MLKFTIEILKSVYIFMYLFMSTVRRNPPASMGDCVSIVSFLLVSSNSSVVFLPFSKFNILRDNQ